MRIYELLKLKSKDLRSRCRDADVSHPNNASAASLRRRLVMAILSRVGDEIPDTMYDPEFRRPEIRKFNGFASDEFKNLAVAEEHAAPFIEQLEEITELKTAHQKTNAVASELYADVQKIIEYLRDESLGRVRKLGRLEALALDQANAATAWLERVSAEIESRPDVRPEGVPDDCVPIKGEDFTLWVTPDVRGRITKGLSNEELEDLCLAWATGEAHLTIEDHREPVDEDEDSDTVIGAYLDDFIKACGDDDIGDHVYTEAVEVADEGEDEDDDDDDDGDANADDDDDSDAEPGNDDDDDGDGGNTGGDDSDGDAAVDDDEDQADPGGPEGATDDASSSSSSGATDDAGDAGDAKTE